MKMPLPELIETMPMFAHFTTDEKNQFAEMKHSLVKFKKDENIITEGEQTKSLYLLVQGTCLITKTEDDAKIRLSKLSPGEIFGEMSFFSNKPRQSSVSATEDVLVVKMNDDFFKKVSPDIRDKIKDYLIGLLINRLDNMNAAIMRISKLMRG